MELPTYTEDKQQQNVHRAELESVFMKEANRRRLSVAEVLVVATKLASDAAKYGLKASPPDMKGSLVDTVPTVKGSLVDAVNALRGALGDNPCIMMETAVNGPHRPHFFSDPDLEDAIRAVIPHLPVNDALMEMTPECIRKAADMHMVYSIRNNMNTEVCLIRSNVRGLEAGDKALLVYGHRVNLSPRALGRHGYKAVLAPHTALADNDDAFYAILDTFDKIAGTVFIEPAVAQGDDALLSALSIYCARAEIKFEGCRFTAMPMAQYLRDYV